MKQINLSCEVSDPRIDFVWECLTSVTTEETKTHSVRGKDSLQIETRLFFVYSDSDEEFIQACLVLIGKFAKITKIRKKTI